MLLDTPFVLLARDGSHAAEILAQRQADFGFDSFMTHEQNLDALGRTMQLCALPLLDEEHHRPTRPESRNARAVETCSSWRVVRRRYLS